MTWRPSTAQCHPVDVGDVASPLDGIGEVDIAASVAIAATEAVRAFVALAAIATVSATKALVAVGAATAINTIYAVAAPTACFTVPASIIVGTVTGEAVIVGSVTCLAGEVHVTNPSFDGSEIARYHTLYFLTAGASFRPR